MSESKSLSKVPMRAGGGVMAIIPRDIDQVWRIAGIAAMGKMAPESLVKNKSFEEAQASCAVAIMAGAELGLTPLMSLRSYAVVNGRPSLWGDGIKAVVRQSGRCEYIKVGGDFEVGWCEAKRSDTGEVLKVEFTIEQARRARLDKKQGPWQDYTDVMLQRRASSRCLNDLFADVLGGIVSAEEAEDYVDFEEIEAPRARSTPPPIPEPDQGDEDWIDLDVLQVRFSGAKSVEEVEAIWDEYDLPSALTHDEDELQRAFDMKSARLSEIEGEENGV